MGDSGPFHGGVELGQVDFGAIPGQHVPGSGGQQRPVLVPHGLPHGLAQGRNVGLKLGAGGRWGRPVPEDTDELVHGYDPAVLKRQGGQKGSLTLHQVDYRAAVGHLDRAQHIDAH